MSLEQATRDLQHTLETRILPCFDRAAVALRKAEQNYAEAVRKLKDAHAGKRDAHTVGSVAK